MSEIVLAQPLPAPRCAGGLNVRTAVPADLPFIDSLQKMHSHMVGFLRYGEIKKYIEQENVLIAEELAQAGPGGGAVQVGYVIAKDQYMKRDDVGIVYQLNVLPLRHRHLVGATLVKAVFDRAAYGCRLFCCWCAQDIQANWFWESIGFVPLAFRTGSRAKQRIHIFWQKRIREGDEGTDYWFPSQTGAGAVGEDRIVLPIPPDTHWRDAKPVLLPGMTQPSAISDQQSEQKTLPGGAAVKPRPEQPKFTKAEKAAIVRSQSKHLGGTPLGRKAVIRGGRIRYVEREDYIAETDAPEGLEPLTAKKPKRPRGATPRAKHDPKYVKAARELRDRFLDQVNAGLILPPMTGKYEVSRQLPAAAGHEAVRVVGQRRLPEAA